jgi:D-aminoacyl-tRNA deacylase
MRAVIQRTNTKAHVSVQGEIVGQISKGLVVLLGVAPNDGEKELKWLADKIMNLRIFSDEEGKMNLSLIDVGGEMLIVSQFTLYGNCRKGRRPNFTRAGHPDIAQPLYDRFCDYVESKEVHVGRGIFGAMMEVSLCNDGPVTLILDTPSDS